MKVAVSILSVKENINETINKLDNTCVDYFHLDIMDGIFVENKTWDIENMNALLKGINKPKDVHLMVQDLDKYIKDFSTLNPDFITFHYEATNDIMKYIHLLHDKKIGIGLSIKPNTDISVLEPYLPFLDLVLVMSVEPGAGGQKFIESSLEKIQKLKELREQDDYHYLIEVDGGINDETIVLVNKAGADMVVSGSYITNSENYGERIENLKK